MPYNPRVPQGTLNKLRGSVSFTDHPELNVTASFLGEEGISLDFEGDASGYAPTMTGAVPSPNPYMLATVTMHLLRTQSLANQFKEQVEDTTTIGDLSVTTDTSTLDAYYLENCTLLSPREVAMNGKDPNYTVMVKGTYPINASLFNLE